MTAIWLRRDGNALVPYSRADERRLADLPAGERLRAEIKRSRNDKHHRLFFALLGLCVAALNRGPAASTTGELLDWIKIKTGHCDVLELPPNLAAAGGQPFAIRTRSISYDKMDQDEFSEFADRAMRLVRDELAPWIAASPEWAEVQEILASARVAEGAA